MTDCHVMLVIEDDPKVAAVLEDLCKSLDYRVRRAATLAEVRVAVEQGGYCGVLLDLQIPADEHSQPLVGSGETALAMLRKRDKRRNAEGHHVLPIIAVTAYSKSHEFVARLFKKGVDEFIPKDFDDGTGRSFMERMEGVLDKIRACFVEAGRGDHAACRDLDGASPSLEVPPKSERTAKETAGVLLELRGELVGQRTVVRVNGVPRELQARNFVCFLRLALAHEHDPQAWSTRHDVGMAGTDDIPKRIRDAINPAMPEGLDVLETMYGGHVRLSPSVKVGIDFEALARHPDERVQKIVAAHASKRRRAASR